MNRLRFRAGGFLELPVRAAPWVTPEQDPPLGSSEELGGLDQVVSFRAPRCLGFPHRNRLLTDPQVTREVSLALIQQGKPRHDPLCPVHHVG
jgi:hypothetical protein